MKKRIKTVLKKGEYLLEGILFAGMIYGLILKKELRSRNEK